MPRFKLSWCRNVLYLAAGLAACELFLLNFIIVYSYVSLKSEISTVLSDADGPRVSLVDKLLRNPTIRNVVFQAKNGGFLSLIQETFERVYIVSDDHGLPTNVTFGGKRLSFVGLDVSRAGEATYLYRRIAQQGERFSKNYHSIVIDIGANDGLLSSNSFNFIQWGWSAILVEPQRSMLMLAQQNLERYIDPYNLKKQKVILVNAMLGGRDGMEDFVLKADDMESHHFDPSRQEDDSGPGSAGELIVKVPCMTVASFAAKYSVPKNFGILSIDAEGVGDKILHQWLDGGFRPAYILYEQIHNKEPFAITMEYVEAKGYRFLTKLDWNYIFEHVPVKSV